MEEKTPGPADIHTLVQIRPSVRWTVVLLIVLAVFVQVAGENANLGRDRAASLDLALVLLALAAGVWFAAMWRSALAAWLLTIGAAASIYLAGQWFGSAFLFQLAWIPVIIGAIFSGFWAATLAAVGAAAVLLASGPTGAVAPLGLSLFSVLVAWASVIAMYLPISHAIGSVIEHSRQAQDALDAARTRSAEAQQALVDLANVNRQLVQANEWISSLRARAENAEQAKTMFVAKVSHEFRTPLNMIIGLVSLMVETPHIYSVALPPEMRSDLEVVQRNCQHLSHMIDDVLDLTRMRAGHLELHRERVDLVELVRAAAETVRPLVEKKGLTFQVEAAAGLSRVYCDRTRIQQVILNLVSNAVRFTEQGRIEVRVECADDRALVSVSDTGPGIAPNDVERIFEPFQQSSRLWQDKGGTGLGLAISREFVQRHGGRLWLVTQLGVGTTFTFYLPVSPSREHIVRPDRWVRPDWVWREEAFRTERAQIGEQATLPRVIVWDETGSLRDELRRYEDQLQVVEAQSIDGAVEALEACPANAVLLNAKTTTRLVAHLEEARCRIQDTPLFACRVPRRLHAALRAGATSYLTKPVQWQDLAEAMEMLERQVRRILIVDDDPDVVHLWERLLQAHDPDLQVSFAYGGGEALQRMATDRPDLVLLDIYMPDMDGWEVLERKNADAAIRPIPVIIVSAHDPAEGPPASHLLAVAMGNGLSVDQLLRVSLQVSNALVTPNEPERPEL